MQSLCRIPVNSSASTKQNQISCAPRTTLCPTSFSLTANTEFCSLDYPRNLGFWYHCAPNTLDLCQTNSCASSPQNPPPLSVAVGETCPSFNATYAACQPAEYIEKFLTQYPQSRSAQTDFGALNYVVFEEQQELWVGIQGTYSTCTWYGDLEYQRLPEPKLHNMNLHQGFLQIAKEIQSSLKQNELTKSPSQKIHLSGHSLGGAAAIILAMLLESDGFQVENVTTFGQPQITDAAGAQLFQQYYQNQFNYLRIIDLDDVVPHLLWVIDNTYQQFGPELRIGQNASGATTYALFEKPDGTPPQSQFQFTIIKNHLLTSYQAHLEALGCSLSI